MRTWLPVHVPDPDTAEQYLQQAEAALDTCTPDEARNLRGEIAAARANIRIWHGDTAGTIEQAEIALRSLDESKTTARSLATLCLGIAYMTQGAAREAAQAFRDLAVANRALNNAYFALVAAMSEAHAYRALGAWTRAISTCEEAIAWSAERHHPSPVVGALYVTLAALLRERGQLDAALEAVTQGITLSKELGATQQAHFAPWQMYGRLVLARIKQAQGDLDGSLEIVGHEREQLEVRNASFAALLDTFEGQVRLAKEEVEAADLWLHRAEAQGRSHSLDLGPLFSWYADELLEVASVQLLIAQGRAFRDPAKLHHALQITDEQRQKAAQLGFLWRQSKALALRALAFDALGHREEAVATLEQALILAQPEGYVGLFADEGLPMTVLLRRLSARVSVAGNVATLLSALGSAQIPDILPSAPDRGGLEEPLTDRELDVLRLLAVGQSNPDIARTLYVEVNTVKTHVKSLYGKLGVHSRVQSVRRARELSLL
jgi:LuxR family maltose regulon positive regulatory protein